MRLAMTKRLHGSLPGFNRNVAIHQKPLRSVVKTQAAMVSTASTSSRICFKLPCKVDFGVMLRLVGSPKELGAWNVADGLDFKWTKGNIWALEIDAPECGYFEYKIVAVNTFTGSVRWEACMNRVMNEQDTDRQVELLWNSPKETEIVVDTEDECHEDHEDEPGKAWSEEPVIGDGAAINDSENEENEGVNNSLISPPEDKTPPEVGSVVPAGAVGNVSTIQTKPEIDEKEPNDTGIDEEEPSKAAIDEKEPTSVVENVLSDVDDVKSPAGGEKDPEELITKPEDGIKPTDTKDEVSGHQDLPTENGSESQAPTTNGALPGEENPIVDPIKNDKEEEMHETGHPHDCNSLDFEVDSDGSILFTADILKEEICTEGMGVPHLFDPESSPQTPTKDTVQDGQDDPSQVSTAGSGIKPEATKDQSKDSSGGKKASLSALGVGTAAIGVLKAEVGDTDTGAAVVAGASAMLAVDDSGPDKDEPTVEVKDDEGDEDGSKKTRHKSRGFATGLFALPTLVVATVMGILEARDKKN